MTSSYLFPNFFLLLVSVVTVAKPHLGPWQVPWPPWQRIASWIVWKSTGRQPPARHLSLSWLLPFQRSFWNLNQMPRLFLVFLRGTGVFTCPEMLTGIDSSPESICAFQGWLVGVIKASTIKRLVSVSGVKAVGIWLKRFNVLVNCDISGEQGTAGILLEIFLWGNFGIIPSQTVAPKTPLVSQQKS